MIAAHRGGAGLGPENAPSTFAMSHALGVRTLETDVRATADGVALAFHDATLDRTTSLTGHVRARSRAELGDQVLSMTDLLGTYDDTEFLIDVKETRAIEPLAAAIRATRSADRVWVAGGWDAWLAAVVDQCPGVRASLGWRGLSTLMWAARCGVGAPRRLAAGVGAAHVPWRLTGVSWMADARVAARLVQQCEDLGLVLRAWTVNDPVDLAWLAGIGVPCLITDHPDVAREVLTGVPSRRPPARLAESWRTEIPAPLDQARCTRPGDAPSVRDLDRIR